MATWITFFIVVLFGVQFSTQTPVNTYQRYVVKFQDGSNILPFLDLMEIRNLLKNQDMHVIHQYEKVFNGFSAQLSPKAVSLIRELDIIEYIEKDALVWTSQSTPVWGLDRIDQIELPLDGVYYPIGDGSGVNIYIVDTGINENHVDFNGRAFAAYDAVDGGTATDCNGHGTHCAGVAAGSVYGVAKGAKLYGVRVLNCQGSGFVSDVIEGCEWIIQNAIRPAVVSFSLSGGASDALDTAVETMIHAGLTVIVAAGNNVDDACRYSPSRVSEAITTGAIDESDKRSYFSNYGPCVDIFAPGVSVESTWIGGDESTNVISGTSVAAPHVAGGAAIYLSNAPSLSPSELKAALLEGAVVGAISEVGENSPNRLLYVGQSDSEVNSPAPQVCERYYDMSFSEFTSPNFPQDYGNNVQCSYRVEAPAGEYVFLRFDSFEVEFENSCSYDSLKVFDGDLPSANQIASLCGNTLPDPIISTGNVLFLLFESDGSETASGFNGTFIFLDERPTTTVAPTPGPDGLRCTCPNTCSSSHIYSPNYPDNYNNNEVCEYNFVAPLGQGVYLAWEELDVESSLNCRQDSLSVYDGPTRLDDLLATECGRRLPDPVASSGRRMLARFVSDSNVTATGFYARYRFVELYCNRDFTVSGSEFTSPNYPDEYGNSESCYYSALAETDQVVTLSFIDFELEDAADCAFDSLVVYDGSTTNSTILAVLCGSDLPSPVRSSGPSMLVVFQSDPSVSASGFRAVFTFNELISTTTYATTDDTISQTTVTSPNNDTTSQTTRDGTMPPATSSVTTTVPQTTTKMLPPTTPMSPVTTTFPASTTTMQPNTTTMPPLSTTMQPVKTTVPASTQTMAPSTTVIPPVKTTMAPNITTMPPVETTTSLFVTTKLPTTTVTSIPEDIVTCTCPSTCNSTHIYSPNYPEPYNNDEICEFSFSSFPNVIRLQWLDFQLPTSVFCSGDSVEVYDGDSDSVSPIANLCGDNLPDDIESSGSSLFVRFTSNSDTVSTGFLAAYQTVAGGCNLLLTEPSGQVTSPNYPNEYENSLDCEYRIEVSPGTTVTLTFFEFSVEFQSNCNYDYLQLYDVVGGSPSLIGTYCGTTFPPVTTSSENQLILIFHTDSSVADSGFSADYITNTP